MVRVLNEIQIFFQIIWRSWKVGIDMKLYGLDFRRLEEKL